MKYAILAAGEGSRLAGEGIATPKPLVSIGGETMLDRLIRIFHANGAEEIDIVINGMSPLTREHLLALNDSKVRFTVKTTPSSMHSLYELMPLLGEGRFCLTTVDTIFREEEFGNYIQCFLDDDADGLMAVTDYVDDERPLYISTDETLRITGFHDEPCGCRFISGGIYCLSHKVFPTLTRCIARGQARMRNFQRQMVEDGLCLRAYPFGKILDVDHAADIAKAKTFLGL